MLHIQVNQQEVKTLYLEKIEEKIKEVDAELVFWDRKELERRTCMCWSSIQKTFFYEKDFPKFKVGSKWYFPAEDTKRFLLKWLRERNA